MPARIREAFLRVGGEIWGTRMKTDGAGQLDRSPIHLLHRAYQSAGDIFHEMKVGGLTPRQLAVLMTVAEHQGLSQTDLVERTGSDRSTVAEIVRRLQRKGLLQRRRTQQDARAYAVKLTEKGRLVLQTAEPLANRVDERVLEALPAKHRGQFLATLAALVGSLEAMATKAQRQV